MRFVVVMILGLCLYPFSAVASQQLCSNGVDTFPCEDITEAYIETAPIAIVLNVSDIIKALEMAVEMLGNPNQKPPNPCMTTTISKESTTLIPSIHFCDQPTPAETKRMRAKELIAEADKIEQQEKNIEIIKKVLSQLKQIFPTEGEVKP